MTAAITFPLLALSVASLLCNNMSGVGAALDVSSPIGIAEYFTLVLAADGQQKPCHVVWRKEKRIGVAFD